MKRSTLLSIIAHVSILGLLIFFGTREYRKPDPETVVPTEIVEADDFEARVEDVDTPEVAAVNEPVDDIQALRDRIAEEMRRREEAFAFDGELPLPAEQPVEEVEPAPAPTPTPAPVVTPAPAAEPEPQVVSSVPSIGDLAPRSSVTPVARPSNLNVVTAGASVPAPLPTENVVTPEATPAPVVAETPSQPVDEIAALVESVVGEIADSSSEPEAAPEPAPVETVERVQTAPVLPPVRRNIEGVQIVGTVPASTIVPEAPVEAPAPVVETPAETTEAPAETTEAPAETTEAPAAASGNGPTSASLPPARSAGALNTNVTAQVAEVVEPEAPAVVEAVESVVDEARDEITALAESLAEQPAETVAVQRAPIVPPSRN